MNSVSIPVGELFEAQSGRPLFTRAYMEAHPGPFPVYSAALARPLGWVDRYDYDGRYLTWVMNGYGGRIQETEDRFSASRDRGVLVPRAGIVVPDLTYLRFTMEPQFVAAAVGRRVDGQLNEYTKIYPTTAEETLITLPINEAGEYDFEFMVAMGEKLRRVAELQNDLTRTSDALRRATLQLRVEQPTTSFSLGDSERFCLSIGNRVLRSEHSDSGVPVFSANVQVPFGRVASSNLADFTKPSLLWGIDGVFDWNLVPANNEFATTDHCGRLQILDDALEPDYVFACLKSTSASYGFDRVFRANLANMKTLVNVVVPVDSRGAPSRIRQTKLAAEFKAHRAAQANVLNSLRDVLKARIAAA